MLARQGFLKSTLLAAGLTFGMPVVQAAAADSESASPARDYTRVEAAYEAPPLVLRDRHGEKVRLDEVLTAQRPILLQFIFTSCATICPVMSASFARAQETLAEIRPDTLMVSVSIDPEYDTPERLRAYAKRHRAGENWRFLTGRYEDVDTVIRAFDAVFEANNKMYHEPYTYFRAPHSETWVRTNGLLSTQELVHEYTRALEAAGAEMAGPAAR